jgi:hypothetical protein
MANEFHPSMPALLDCGQEEFREENLEEEKLGGN